MTLPVDEPDRSKAEKYLLLTGLTPKEVRDLWDKYSGLPGLLDSEKYYYSSKSDSYYRINGRRITDRQIRAAVDKVATAQKAKMRKTTQQLLAGTILFSVWYTRMEKFMAVLYKTIYTLAIGGFLFEDEEARNAFYLFVLAQFKWLDNFFDQMKNKSQPLNGTAMTRAGLYGEYANSLYQNVVLEQRQKVGFTEARRVLGQNEIHCYKTHERLGCIELAVRGWVPIQQVVPLGGAACYSNCHCHIEYR